METRRQMPDGGHHLVLPGHGAYRAAAVCFPQCGPEGVPWLLIAYDMPGKISELRLTNLTTGTTSLLLTVVRSGMAADPNEEHEHGSTSADAEDHGAAQEQAGAANGAADATSADEPVLPALEGQAAMEAPVEAAASIREQDTCTVQPSAELNCGTQDNASSPRQAGAKAGLAGLGQGHCQLANSLVHASASCNVSPNRAGALSQLPSTPCASTTGSPEAAAAGDVHGPQSFIKVNSTQPASAIMASADPPQGSQASHHLSHHLSSDFKSAM